MLNEKRLYRSRDNRMVGGICAGLGNYIGIDPTVVRLLFALGTIFGLGSLVIVYLIMLVVIPEEPMEAPSA
jgi:phage shock protein PspC (stress-responsive transcriptional regulator)